MNLRTSEARQTRNKNKAYIKRLMREIASLENENKALKRKVDDADFNKRINGIVTAGHITEIHLSEEKAKKMEEARDCGGGSP